MDGEMYCEHCVVGSVTTCVRHHTEGFASPSQSHLAVEDSLPAYGLNLNHSERITS